MKTLMKTYRTSRPLPIHWGRAAIEPVSITFIGDAPRVTDLTRVQRRRWGVEDAIQRTGAAEGEDYPPDCEFCE